MMMMMLGKDDKIEEKERVTGIGKVSNSHTHTKHERTKKIFDPLNDPYLTLPIYLPVNDDDKQQPTQKPR